MVRAEELLHFIYHVKYAFISNPVVDKICLFPVIYNSLAAKYIQMLRNIGIGRLYHIGDVANGELSILQKAENLKPYRMRHRF